MLTKKHTYSWVLGFIWINSCFPVYTRLKLNFFTYGLTGNDGASYKSSYNTG